jgi:hypothetical protein
MRSKMSATRSSKRKRSIQKDTEAPDSRKAPRLAEDGICDECAKIDFKSVSRIDLRELREKPWGILLCDPARWSASAEAAACHVCRVFHTAVGGWQSRDWEIRAFSLLDQARYYMNEVQTEEIRDGSKQAADDQPHLSDLATEDQPFLALVPKGETPDTLIFTADVMYGEMGCVLPAEVADNKPRLIMPRCLKRYVDGNLIGRWLSHYSDNHQLSCSREWSTTAAKRLIDCTIPGVVVAPQSCKYIALSYVWGNQPQQTVTARASANGVLDLTELPRTVADAIELTRRINIRYLWVDRYCINQDDAAEKHDQIHGMDTIYHGSYLTIIAAAGDDDDRDLPGVRQPRRTDHFQATVRGQCCLSSSRSSKEYPSIQME